MTAGTDFSATVAWVAEKLGLPGIPYEAALNASDKERMRRRFKEAGIPSPEFLILREAPAAGFSLPFPLPAVVKPVDNMGGRGCRRIDSIDELKSAVPEALKFSRSGRAIVEAYMDGPEFSVDAIVYRGNITICGLADRHIYFPPYFIEMGHTMPTNLDIEGQRALLETFTAAVRALGITTGAAKGDLKLTSRGPMIGEIAARLSGGYMSGWTYPYSSGVEPTRGAILAALGKVPDGLVPARSWTSAERAFISIPGKVRSIRGLEAARSAEYVKDLFLRSEAGSRVKFPENNVGKCGNIISAAPDRDRAVSAAERAARSVLIRLEAPDPETEAFLGLGSGLPAHPLTAEAAFPPSAFVLSDHIKALLAAFPGNSAGAPDFNPYPGWEREIVILDFPALTGAALTDYAGRTIPESLRAVRAITELPLGIIAAPSSSHKALCLGRCFWAALVRGGYQGAA
jgi:biotin carboxylase